MSAEEEPAEGSDEPDISQEGDVPQVASSDVYEVLNKNLKNAGKRTWLHRIYIIASLDIRFVEEEDLQRRAALMKTQLDEFGGEVEQQIRQLHNTYREETASGLLLLYPRQMIHMIESSEDTIVDYLRVLRGMKDQPQPRVTDVKVLLFAHDIPERLFEAWSFRSIVACARERLEEGFSYRKAATGCLKQLLGLAIYLQRTPKVNLRNTLDNLTERVHELLPSEDVLLHLMQSPSLLSVESFLDSFYAEQSFVDDSELVWPMPSHLYPYY